MLEAGASYGHVFGGGEVDQSQAVFVRAYVGAELSYHRSEFLLLANLSVKISDDDFDVMFWAAVVRPVQLLVKCVLVVIFAS